jgi:hypothetical protein
MCIRRRHRALELEIAVANQWGVLGVGNDVGQFELGSLLGKCRKPRANKQPTDDGDNCCHPPAPKSARLNRAVRLKFSLSVIVTSQIANLDAIVDYSETYFVNHSRFTNHIHWQGDAGTSSTERRKNPAQPKAERGNHLPHNQGLKVLKAPTVF